MVRFEALLHEHGSYTPSFKKHQLEKHWAIQNPITNPHIRWKASLFCCSTATFKRNSNSPFKTPLQFTLALRGQICFRTCAKHCKTIGTSAENYNFHKLSLFMTGAELSFCMSSPEKLQKQMFPEISGKFALRNDHHNDNWAITYLSRKCPSEEGKAICWQKSIASKGDISSCDAFFCFFWKCLSLYQMLDISTVPYHIMLHVQGFEVVKCTKYWEKIEPLPKRKLLNSYWTHLIDFDGASQEIILSYHSREYGVYPKQCAHTIYVVSFGYFKESLEW